MHDPSRTRPPKAAAIAITLLSIHSSAISQPPSSQQQQQQRHLYQTDSVGNLKYHAPSWTIQPDGRVIERNRYGDNLYHKQQYRVIGDQVMPIDSVGNPQPHKGVGTLR
jgi:hypothetical protein